MTRILFSVTITIAGDVTAVHVYDDAPEPFTYDPFVVFDPIGGAAYPPEWTISEEYKP